MKVVYANRAVADISEIFDYIEKQDLNSAMAVEADIRQACERLSQFPYSNPQTRRPS
jgi:plasmid stabilization system protein ParE